MKFFMILLVVFFSWVVFDFDYDPEGDYRAMIDNDRSKVPSLERMAIWSPVSAKTLFQDFKIAADNEFGSNLAGLNIDQIREISNERRIVIYEQAIDSISLAIEKINNTGVFTISLASNFKEPEEGIIPKQYNIEQLEQEKLKILIQLSSTRNEINSFFNFRSFPTTIEDIYLVISFWTSFFKG